MKPPQQPIFNMHFIYQINRKAPGFIHGRDSEKLQHNAATAIQKSIQGSLVRNNQQQEDSNN